MTLQQALAFHQQGNVAAAEQAYTAVIKAEPRNFTAHQLLGTLRLQQGRFADAVSSLDRAIGAKPDFAEAHGSRGLALCNLQRFQEAVASFGKALKLKPKAPDVLMHRALALYYLKKPEAALASYDEALALQPQNPDAHMARGNILRELKRFDAALTSYDAALRLRATAELFVNRGIVFSEMARAEEALVDFDRAIALKPALGEAHYNRGRILDHKGQTAEALSAFETAVRLQTRLPALYHDFGLLLRRQGRLADALAAFDQALAVDPRYLQAWNDRGLALKDMKRFDEALASFDQALAIKPDFAGALNNRGLALWDMDRIEDAAHDFTRAIAAAPGFALPYRNRAAMLWARREAFDGAVKDFTQALQLDPDSAFARGELTHLKMIGGGWQDFGADVAKIDAGVRAGQKTVLPFVYQALSASPADLKICAQSYATEFPASPPLRQGTNRRPGRIRIGYLCGEFRSHATSYLTVGLYEQHDRDRFEVLAFDNGAPDTSDTRQRLDAAFDRIIPIATLGAADAARRITAEDVDILVNLNGYYGKGRMDVFACRPAPIQVNFLGFPGTLGADYIDYIVADRVVIPEDEQHHYFEKVAYLPGCYQANDSRRERPAAATDRAAHGLPENAFVFCYFNHTYKLTPATFAVWMRILKQADNAVLWILNSSAPFAGNIRRAAQAHGIAPERLILAPTLPHPQHLARMPLGDLFLDSLPYTAHTTGSDALWMGLPLLTCRGTTFPGRVAASLLGAVGLPELITETEADYEARAVELAQNPAQLASLKEKLARSRDTAPLFDTARYTRDLEAAYQAMFDTWHSG